MAVALAPQSGGRWVCHLSGHCDRTSLEEGLAAARATLLAEQAVRVAVDGLAITWLDDDGADVVADFLRWATDAGIDASMGGAAGNVALLLAAAVVRRAREAE